MHCLVGRLVEWSSLRLGLIRARFELTQVILVQILYPICDKKVRHEDAIELCDEPFLLGSIVV